MPAKRRASAPSTDEPLASPPAPSFAPAAAPPVEIKRGHLLCVGPEMVLGVAKYHWREVIGVRQSGASIIAKVCAPTRPNARRRRTF